MLDPFFDYMRGLALTESIVGYYPKNEGTFHARNMLSTDRK